MKAFIAVFLFVASTNAGLLGSNIAYTTNTITYAAAPLASSYQYNYRYAQPTYYTVAAPAIQTVAVAKQVVQAPTIVRQVATAPVVATVKAAPVAVQVAQPVVKTVAVQVAQPIVKTVVSSPVVKTIAAPVAYAQPAFAYAQPAFAAAPLTYTYPNYAPYYGSYILKK